VLALRSKQHELWHVHSRCALSGECIIIWGLQALLTTRKGKKRFAMFDLTVTLTWQGLWVEDDKKQVCNVSLIDRISDTLSQGYTDLQTVCTLPMSYHLAPCMLTQVEYLPHFAQVMSRVEPKCKARVIPRCSCTCLPLGVIAINSTCSMSTAAAVTIS